MRWLAMDLHVHTVLSGCADIEMVPPRIVQAALALGLAAIAITDHNSAENVEATQQAAQGAGLVVFAGMEVQTREEVHLLALFGQAEQARALQAAVYERLPAEPNRPEHFGEQLVVDALGRYVAAEPRLLQVSVSLGIEEAAVLIRRLGGLCLAAHVDRPSYSVFANLGFIPPALLLDGAEASKNADPGELAAAHKDLAGLGVGAFGDAHRLAELTARTQFFVQEPTIEEVGLALHRRQGRTLRVAPIRIRSSHT